MVTQNPAGSYETGGGGVVLEHLYGATVLADLLTGDPLAILGVDASVVRIEYQSSAFSPVDDILVVGSLPNGQCRSISIGVRRSPSFVPSHRPTVELVRGYLRVLRDRWSEMAAGRWRLGLVAVRGKADVAQVARLAGIARAKPAEAVFRAEVARAPRLVRERLAQLDRIVASVAGELDGRVPPGELTWRLLFGLWAVEARLEGSDQADRAGSVGRLRKATRSGTLGAAARLFTRLAYQVHDAAPAGAVVTEAALRGELVGCDLARSPVHPAAWAVLDRLADRLRDRTGTRLKSAEADLEIDRPKARAELLACLRKTGIEKGMAVVSGEPDVGKSALTLRVVEDLRSTGAGVVALSLRDLPRTMVDFEAALTADAQDVLAGTPVDEVRLLVMDGAEIALEGGQVLLVDLTTAALRAGLGVVAVTRADAQSAVVDGLVSAQRAVKRAGPAPAVHEVPALDNNELAQLTGAFPGLTGLARDARSAWVLRRPGYVDLLLRSGPAQALPDRGLSEADVLSAIWQRLVRDPASGLPDARAHTLMALAHHELLPGAPSPYRVEAAALPSLRADGLLLSAGPDDQWTTGEDFAGDLVRDLAVAALLLTRGWSPLVEAGAPRWAVRATRLACQAKLAAAGAGTEAVRADLHRTLDRIAVEHGLRWAELPLEAVLTLGTADTALRLAWPVLSEEQRATLLRLARHRHTDDGVGDPVVLSPLVDLFFCRAWSAVEGAFGYEVINLVVAWLRGLERAGEGPHPIRAAVRDVMHDRLSAYRSWRVEVFIPLLGPDMDSGVEEYLRGVAAAGGDGLGWVVESDSTVRLMAERNPNLLFDLAEAYYLGGSSTHSRSHVSGRPLDDFDAGRGPFEALLRADFDRALTLVRRMIDRAVSERDSRGGKDEHGLELDLPDGSRHVCEGDYYTWSWYDRSSVFFGPCKSALLAVERVADHLVDVVGVPIGEMVDRLLGNRTTLAMAGLVVGMLTRRIESCGDRLDPWLVQPDVWSMEERRCAFPELIRTKYPESEYIYRAFDFRITAMHLVTAAVAAGDRDRVESLEAVGVELWRRVREHVERHGSDTAVARDGRQWSRLLDAGNFHFTWQDGTVVRVVPPDGEPEDEVESRAVGRRPRPRWQVVGDRYANPFYRAIDHLAEDLAFVRSGTDDDQDPFGEAGHDVVMPVVRAALAAHSTGSVVLATQDLRWAADRVMDLYFDGTGENLVHDRFDSILSKLQIGKDLLSLLLPTFSRDDVDHVRLCRGLDATAKHATATLGKAFGYDLDALWSAPCDLLEPGEQCRHAVAWAAVEAGLRWCATGDGDDWRIRALPDGPLTDVLPTVPPARLDPSQMAGSVAACVQAATGRNCAAQAAGRLLGVLLRTHGRAFGLAMAEHATEDTYYGGAYAITARALFTAAARGNHDLLTAYVEELMDYPAAVECFLRYMTCEVSGSAELRQALPDVWPRLTTAILDRWDSTDDPRVRVAASALVPVPEERREQQDFSVESDLDLGTLDVLDLLNAEPARPPAAVEAPPAPWLDPEHISDLVERWIPLVSGQPSAVDALVGLARTAPADWQVSKGLRWVERVAESDYSAIGSRAERLVEWLAETRTTDLLTSDDEVVLHRVVDALAAAGDRRAAELQATLE